MRRKVVIGAAVLAALSFGGGAYAASLDSDLSTPRAFLGDVAKRLGVSTQTLTAALDGAVTDELNAAVKAGRLTRAQANAIERRLRAHWLAWFVPFGVGPRRPFGVGPGGRFAPDRLRGERRAWDGPRPAALRRASRRPLKASLDPPAAQPWLAEAVASRPPLTVSSPGSLRALIGSCLPSENHEID